jgi:glycosyltransferase involved in cell wall biosynthesis
VKIAYLSGSVVPSRAANGVHVMRMCNAFAAVGCGPVLHAIPGAPHDPDSVYRYYGVDHEFAIRWHSRPNVWGRDYVYGFRAARAAAMSSPDFVYCRHLPGSWAATAMTGLPVVFEAHHPISSERPAHLWMFRRMIARRNFLGIVVITRALEEDLISRYPGLRGRVLVAPDGADVPASGSEPALPPANGRLRVGYVGHLYPGRGIDLIVELARRCPWADFHLIGGTAGDLAYWREATSDVPRITLHGFRPPSETDGFRTAMDVLVAPYQSSVSVAQRTLDTAAWMSPLKIFEYMAAGKPIVASDLPALREVLSDANSILIPSDDIDAWVEAVSRLRDPNLRARLGQAAEEDFLARYTWRQRAVTIRDQVAAWTASRLGKRSGGMLSR